MVTHLISRKKGRFVRSGTSIILAIAIAVGSHHAVIPGCDMKFGILWFVSFSILHFHTRKYVGVVCLFVCSWHYYWTALDGCEEWVGIGPPPNKFYCVLHT